MRRSSIYGGGSIDVQTFNNTTVSGTVVLDDIVYSMSQEEHSMKIRQRDPEVSCGRCARSARSSRRAERERRSGYAGSNRTSAIPRRNTRSAPVRPKPDHPKYGAVAWKKPYDSPVTYSALGQHAVFVIPNPSDPRRADRHSRAVAVFIPDIGKRHGFQLLEQCETLGVVAVDLEPL